MLIEFCFPVFNEEKILKDNILLFLKYCQTAGFNFDWKIIIINNGSTDNSYRIGIQLEKEFPELIKLKEIKQAGRGRAIKKYWLESQADILTFMDVDLAVSLDNINALIKPVMEKRADLVIGSRLLPESKIKRSFIREVSSRVCNFCSRAILNHGFYDMQCGFKAMDKHAFLKVAPNIKNKKWFFDTELIIFAKYFHFKILEIPVDWSENRYTKRDSKVNLLKDSIRYLYNSFLLRIRILKLPK